MGEGQTQGNDFLLEYKLVVDCYNSWVSYPVLGQVEVDYR